jgi:S-adenosylmethionine synthetase
MELCVRDLPGPGTAAGEVELVERKGRGHPDTLCDAIAEAFSRALCRYYLERCGRVLHHNVDKVLLAAGVSRPAFGGGEVLAPFEIFLAGRASAECEGARVPLEELALEATRAVLRERLHALDVDRHVRIRCLVRPGSRELVALYAEARANDTSFGVGYAPLSLLERVVLRVERELSAPETTRQHPVLGEDVKVMGVRRGERIHLDVACALVGRHCADLGEYLAGKRLVAERAAESARRETAQPIATEVNAGDEPERGNLYLTVTGTSAEAGDDGEAGRGNRVNGLIAPYRPTTLESVAGKNPVTHVGKLYNLAAGLVAAALVEEIPGVAEAECRLVSRIGRPVADPQLADVRLRCLGGAPAAASASAVAEILRRHLAEIDAYAGELVAGSLALDRWPLRRAD